MQRIGLLLTLALAGPCLAADRDEIGTGNPRPIPEVRSLYALRKLPPAHGLGGWVLRLGVADSGPEGGPWKLLLCHATNTGSAAEPSAMSPTSSRLGGAEDIGPLSFTVGLDAPGRRAPENIRRRVVVRLSDDSERLYVAPIPTAWKGEYVVKVWSEKRKLIQACRLTVAAPPPCPWMPLARMRNVKTEEDRTLAPLLVPREVWPAHPRFTRDSPIWRQARGRQRQMLRPDKDGAGPGPLPGMLPPGPAYERRYYGNRAVALAEGLVAYPLKLSLRKDTLVLGCEIPLLDWADEHLLGRWWVNGKPVYPRPRAERELQEVSRKLAETREFRILLRLGTYLGTLKAGDKVSVQALYCPAGTERIRATRHEALQKLRQLAALADGPAKQPMLSNKITFDVTKAMIIQRKADAMEPEGTR